MFGFEESYGYLTGSYVRDKDGVDGAYMICEMFSYYATQGISLLDRLDELYKTYGYCLNTLHSYEFDGSAGFARMQSIMQAFRGGIKEFGGKKVVRLLDYVQGLDGLPKSDVLKFLLENNCSLVVRPSGTEPKLKIYISVSAENKEILSNKLLIDDDILCSRLIFCTHQYIQCRLRISDDLFIIDNYRTHHMILFNFFEVH